MKDEFFAENIIIYIEKKNN